MCVRNDRDKCAHMPVNDAPQLYSKGIRFLKLLLDGYTRRRGKGSETHQDMLPSKPVDCSARYDTNLEKVTEKQVLSDLVSEDGSKFVQGHIYNYSRHCLHTEETMDMLQ